MELQVGDRVYWRIRIGVFLRTFTGKITSIDEKKRTAAVALSMQNTYGTRNVQLGTLTKCKDQRF